MPLYLNAATSKNNPNIGGIKCYRKHGFCVVPVPPIERSDGPNFFMVCDPKKKRKSKKRNTKKTFQKGKRVIDETIKLIIVRFISFMFITDKWF